MHFNILKLFFVIGSLYFTIYLKADIYDYIYPFKNPSYSNYGSLGLIQNPNARFHKEGTLGFTWSHNEPYLRGSIVAYPFDWFEAAFQYTDVNNELYSQVKAFSGSQTLKDKSFDAKFRIIKENKYIPQIAIGLRDLGGTGRFASEYIVINKFVNRNLDISLGIGWANLNGNKIANPLSKLSSVFETRNQGANLGGQLNLKNFFSGDAGYFGGIEYSLPNFHGMKFKIELDGTNYQTESSPLFQKSKINYGVIYPLTKRFIFKLSSTRGNTLNFGFSYAFDAGSKNPRNIVKTKKVQIDRPDVVQAITKKSDENLYKASLLYLGRQGINLQKATATDNELHIVYAQFKYRSPALSAGRTIDLVNQIAPDNIETIKVSEVNGGIGLFTASIDREIYDRYESFDDTNALNHYIKTEPYHFSEAGHKFNPKAQYPAIFTSMGPDIRSQIGGPDGFFFGDLKWTIDSEVLFKRNLSLITVASYSLYDNMDRLGLTSDSVLPHVRTDIIDYLKESRHFSIRRMQLNYYNQTSKSFFYKLSGGIFESMFNGFGFEALYRPYSKNYGIGVDLWQVYQRDYNQMFSVRDYKTITGHISYYYQEPKTNILLTLKGGRYLAKDSGFTFDVSRVFRSGLRVGGFFSLTDISEEEFGEGSFDKGFYFWIPVEIFTNRYFKRTFGWGLRPITRDGAQRLNYGYPLFGVTDTSSEHRFRRRIGDFYD